MGRREIWKDVLDTELRRWAELSYDELVDALRDLKVYVVERDTKEYQVEVQRLETTDMSIQVLISVDDGRLPASLVPSTATFVVEKKP